MIQSLKSGRSQLEPEFWAERHQDLLNRYARSRLRDVHSAENVVQETFLAGLRFQYQYSGTGTERAWLMGILKRKIVDHVRRNHRNVSIATASAASHFNKSDPVAKKVGDPLAVDQDPSKPLERKEFWETLQTRLQDLSDLQAKVFRLREIEGMSSKEICQELKISLPNFWVTLHRARLRLSKSQQSKRALLV